MSGYQVFEIPTSPQAQTLRINLGGTFYRLTLKWADVIEGGWVLDIDDDSNAPIINGIPLVTGADLLAQYKHLGILGSLIVQTDHAPDATPTYGNLGVTSHLYYLPPQAAPVS